MPLPPPPSCSSLRLTPSVLKSALQKNVRRGRPGPAVRVAVGLMRRTSLVELIRRLQIIAVEDAMLCPTFPKLAWLTAAISRGYQVQERDVLMVLETVDLLCNVSVRDAEAVRSGGKEKAGGHVATALDQDLESLVQSLRMRASYGGMTGDVAMLLNAARAWHRRFLQDAVLWRGRIEQAFDQARSRASPFTVRNAIGAEAHILKGDIPPAALDFHCCDISEELARGVLQQGESSEVYRRFGRDCKDGIERLMWLYSSSVTNKCQTWPDEEAQVERPNATGFDRLLWDTELLPQARRWTRRFLGRVGL